MPSINYHVNYPVLSQEDVGASKRIIFTYPMVSHTDMTEIMKVNFQQNYSFFEGLKKEKLKGV